MTHLDRVKSFISRQPADIKRDQFFLIDPDVMKQLIKTAKITKKDRVLEVGTGLGFVTEMLAVRSKSVLSIEIDTRFKPYTNRLPSNVELIYGDAYRLLNDTEFRASHKPPTKTVSSIPYSQAQNMLHNYTNWKWYQGDLVWLAPITLAEKVNKEHILSAYFKAEVIQEVSKSAFFPQPNTTSAIIYFHRIPNPVETKNADIYFRRWLYNHEDMKVRNALREGIIAMGRDLHQCIISKKQAKQILTHLELPEAELEKLTNNIRPEYYFQLSAPIEKQLQNMLSESLFTLAN